MEHELGELSNEEEDIYIPLERPVAVKPILQTEYRDESSEVESDKDSDVDSDAECVNVRRPSVKKKRKVEAPREKIKNKFNVWCDGLQEEALMDTLGNCDVEAIDRSRNVESYNYCLKYKFPEVEGESLPAGPRKQDIGGRRANKRRHWETGSMDLRDWLKCHKSSETDTKGDLECSILDLEVTGQDCDKDIATDIASKLSESKKDLIMRVVTVLGKEKAMELYKKTKEIEEDGGMMILNGSRRRTAGGVFLLLLKRDEDISKDLMREIFIEEQMESASQQRREAKQRRKKKTNNIKKTLIEDGLLPALLTRADLMTAREQEEDRETKPEPELAVTNPPPSPATDGDQSAVSNLSPSPATDGDQSAVSNLSPSPAADTDPEHTPQRSLRTYEDDDFLDITADNMDVF